jgi:C4-dicarboxylate transporter/malic acid transport protein
MDVDTARRPSLDETIEHFNPAWFAAVMGTGVVPLAISFFTGSWVRTTAALFTILSVAMFLAILVPWTLRLFLHPDAVRHDLHHPIAASFFPTMPIAVVVIALDLLKFPDLFLTPEVSREVALWMWVVGAAGIYLAAFIVLPRIYRSDAIELSHANFGWFIPPVAKLLIPVAGFELAGHFPERFELTFTLSIVSLGIGFFLFLFVGSLVYHRYVLESLPVSKFAATSFIAIAPTAIIAVALFKLQQLLEGGVPLPVDAAAVGGMLTLLILAAWGFAAWAFVMAVVIVITYLRHFDLPYALSWWAYTFPLGALSVATGTAWKVSGIEVIHTSYLVAILALLGAWIVVTVRTVHAMWTGKVFESPHEKPPFGSR